MKTSLLLTIKLVGENMMIIFPGAVSSVVRALASHARGPRFKSSTAHQIRTLNKYNQVEIINKTEKWSKIRTKPKKNEKAMVGWVGSKLLDSEIK